MTTITIAKGDGIGPEIMDATLKILFAAGATIKTEEIEVGEKFTFLVIHQEFQRKVGILLEKQNLFKGSNYNTSRRWLQKFECYHTQISWLILQCAAMQEFTSIYSNKTSCNGRSYYQRK